MQKVIILGSSNSNGNTQKIVNYITEISDWQVIDLNDYDFSYFDYDYKNADDDFLPIMEEIIDKYDVMLFATPVYWYSMSGIMKVFFDRISDLLSHHKELGRNLKSKKMTALSCSGTKNINPSFYYPFKATADYLDMNYIGDIHVEIVAGKLSKAQKREIDNFIRKLESKL